jgi:hypothetical protein
VSLETALAIAGVALSLGGLVPAIWPKAPAGRAVFVVTLSALLTLSSVGVWRSIEHRKNVEYWADEVMRLLAQRPLTIEQLNQRLPHPPFTLLVEAVDGLVRAGQIRFEPITVFDSASSPRSDYIVGVYSTQQVEPLSPSR